MQYILCYEASKGVVKKAWCACPKRAEGESQVLISFSQVVVIRLKRELTNSDEIEGASTAFHSWYAVNTVLQC